MKNLKSIFEKYLERTDRLKDLKLGESDSRVIASEDNKFLAQLLEKQSIFNKNIIIVYIVMLCLLFSIGVYLVFRFIDSPNTMGIIFGGTFLSLLAIVDRLRKIWKEKSIMDMILILIDGLPKEQIAAVIETLYWNDIRKSK